MSEKTKPGSHITGQEISRRGLLEGSVALGLSAALGTGALSTAAKADTPRRGGKLVVGAKGGSATDVLDPTIMLSQVPAYLSYQIGNRLVERTPEGPLKGELAESWEALDGAKRWVFKLRKGVEFHNGKKFTSADMVYSLNRHRGPKTQSGAAAQMKGIEDIKADGPYELTILLREPDVNLPYLMANVQLIAQPENDKPDNGISTGPYVVDKAEAGVRYTFHRNPNYFKPDRAWFDNVEILVINDDTARLSALLSGSAHLISAVPPPLVARLKNSAAVNVVSAPSSLYYYFVMRCDMPPFDNPDLRLALKYAVDREMMLKRILVGHGSIGNDSPINSAFPLFSDDIPQHRYDPEKAQFHYKKSGHSGPVTLHTSDGAFPGAVDASVIFQQNAAKAGITIELKREPADGYWDNVWRKAPFCASYWGSNSTEDQALSIAYASGAPWNDSHWSRPEFDKLLLQARSELDAQRRKALYRQATTMVHDDGGHIVVMFADDISGMSRKVKGFVGDHFGANGKNTERCWFEA
jgi:peptide/nickel transport system substrate-binding protein